MMSRYLAGIERESSQGPDSTTFDGVAAEAEEREINPQPGQQETLENIVSR